MYAFFSTVFLSLFFFLLLSMYSKAKQAVHVVIEGVFCVKAAQHLEILFSVSFFFFLSFELFQRSGTKCLLVYFFTNFFFFFLTHFRSALLLNAQPRSMYPSPVCCEVLCISSGRSKKKKRKKRTALVSPSVFLFVSFEIYWNLFL